MNGRNQQQPSTEWLPRCYDALEEDNTGRSDRVQAAVAMQAFSFGPFRIIPYARLLECGGSPVPLGSRAFDVLCLLISRPGEVLSKGELMAGAWPNVTVEESNLRYNISLLRRALGDRQRDGRYVVNVPGRGYCFVASVAREAMSFRQGHEQTWQLA
jgi:DNA-binding winged helix-turn-helix (wHTH) protein